jgi:hypothetical protein
MESSANRRPFIPRDKPRLWVVFTLSGLIGMGIGLIGFGAAWLHLGLIAAVAVVLFAICWIIAAVSWIGFVVRLVSGCYRDIQARDWNEQVW